MWSVILDKVKKSDIKDILFGNVLGHHIKVQCKIKTASICNKIPT